jgi:hypothetical protein
LGFGDAVNSVAENYTKVTMTKVVLGGKKMVDAFIRISTPDFDFQSCNSKGGSMATASEKASNLIKWLGDEEPSVDLDLNEALYTLNEGGGWPDYIEIRNRETALMCWRLVERLKGEKLPDEFKI